MARKPFQGVAAERGRIQSGVGPAPAGPVRESCQVPDTIQSCATEAAQAYKPTAEEIRRRAYEICQSRNGSPGDCVADWLQAEQELRARRAAQPL